MKFNDFIRKKKVLENISVVYNFLIRIFFFMLIFFYGRLGINLVVIIGV